MRTYYFLFIVFGGLSILSSCEFNDHRKVVVNDPSGYYRDEYYVVNDSIKDGQFLRFFSDGKLSDSCGYKMGKLEGIKKLYSSKGNLQTLETYKNGKLNGDYIVYYPDGNVKIKQKFIDDRLEDISYRYYPNGKIQEEVTMKNGLENGAFKEYYPSGVLHWKGLFVDGANEQDTLYEYDKNGELMRKLFCEMGYCRTFWRMKEGYIGLDPKLEIDRNKLQNIVDSQNQ